MPLPKRLKQLQYHRNRNANTENQTSKLRHRKRGEETGNIPHSAIGFAVSGVNFQRAYAVVDGLLMFPNFAMGSGPIAKVNGVLVVERNGVSVRSQGLLETFVFHELVACAINGSTYNRVQFMISAKN